MDISCLMTCITQIEEEKLRERARVSKKTQVDGGGYSHKRSGSHNKYQGGQKQGGQRSTNTTSAQFIKDKEVVPKPLTLIALSVGGPTKRYAWFVQMRASSAESLGTKQ